jgi:uncharacterized protein YdeI (YjbR/CyaY-like superfamily)
MLPISADHREGAGVTAGDEVLVALTLDTEARTLAIPADFQNALASDGQTRRLFEGLSYSKKQRFTLAIEQAKAPETRQRRIDKAMSDLRAGRA